MKTRNAYVVVYYETKEKFFGLIKYIHTNVWGVFDTYEQGCAYINNKIKLINNDNFRMSQFAVLPFVINHPTINLN